MTLKVATYAYFLVLVSARNPKHASILINDPIFGPTTRKYNVQLIFEIIHDGWVLFDEVSVIAAKLTSKKFVFYRDYHFSIIPSMGHQNSRAYGYFWRKILEMAGNVDRKPEKANLNIF